MPPSFDKDDSEEKDVLLWERAINAWAASEVKHYEDESDAYCIKYSRKLKFECKI